MYSARRPAKQESRLKHRSTGCEQVDREAERIVISVCGLVVPLALHPILILRTIAPSFNGRTVGSEPINRGSNPWGATNLSRQKKLRAAEAARRVSATEPLEQEFQSELKDARIAGADHLAERAAIEGGSHAVKVRMVQHIECFRTELQA